MYCFSLFLMCVDDKISAESRKYTEQLQIRETLFKNLYDLVSDKRKCEAQLDQMKQEKFRLHMLICDLMAKVMLLMQPQH